MKRTTLVIEPRGGLGNRFLSLSSAYNIAKACDIATVIVLWNNINECGCNWNDVFSKLPDGFRVVNLKFINDSYKAMLKKGRMDKIACKFLQRTVYKIFKTITTRMHLEANGIFDEDRQEVLKKQLIERKGKTTFIESYSKFYGEVDLSEFVFNLGILAKVEAFLKRTGQYDAMHIRRTDNATAIQNSPTELFVEKANDIIEKNSKAKIYIATDDVDVLNIFKEKFPNNVISELNGNLSRRTSDGIQFALYEMLILAGAKTLYASYFSTFSSLANCIGKNEIIVVKKD